MKHLYLCALLTLASFFLVTDCGAQSVTKPAGVSNTAAASDMKLFEAATNLANTMTSWALVMIGGSILAILSTGYHRPEKLIVRCAYFAFVPAWIFLSLSVYSGTRVQSTYLGALFSRPKDLLSSETSLNHDAISQIARMEWGLAFFGVWLVVYLGWWVFNKDSNNEANKP